MERTNTNRQRTLLRKGLKELSRHRPDLAIETLRLAVDAIPPACGEELSSALYWLSIALLRLDRRELAIKSLASAQKLRPRGHARSIYLRSINGYGMLRQPTPALDDFYAFTNIQMATYLLRKPRRRFDSFQERDIVLKLILDAWKTLASGGAFDGMECCEKLDYFRRVRPNFPSFGFDANQRGAKRLAFAFGQTSGDAATQRCACGSGLPAIQCCGRVKSLREL
ncbi:hypothetical protein LWX53_03425 [bacterium]|nr:hypothetical protein [bacterium]